MGKTDGTEMLQEEISHLQNLSLYAFTHTYTHTHTHTHLHTHTHTLTHTHTKLYARILCHLKTRKTVANSIWATTAIALWPAQKEFPSLLPHTHTHTHTHT